ncbi:hypothetical protein [Mycolicibacterium parafortuitum]|uniref:Transmembrane protein n=1 Tax=Mycolicibacterium parafortuitum TaxID=39692 RepID=A0A375YHI3_MYCPF|nr:hypothetical protein [Mycolicibacterium parafortuitum]ORB30661.1 hypothetical protein BST38_10300 [Mycolicibacterium parafortuitum]SRX80592.1 hypothetical protein MPP7335_02335 [Mycolicibacterium parafortuitum]
MADLSQHTRGLRRGAVLGEAGVRDAIRTGLGVAVTGLVFLFVADMWNSTCTGSLAQALGCGAAAQATLALGAPAIMLAGALWSLVRGFRMRAERAWQAAALALLVLALVCTVLSLPSLPGR